MRLMAFTDYGLRALMRLAGDPERDFTVGTMAQDLGISHNHLIKVIRALAKGGIVRTRRGIGGGIELARPAAEITLEEVVRLLEARQYLVDCFRPDGGTCSLKLECRLRDRLNLAREAFFSVLRQTTVADCAYPSLPFQHRR